MTNANSKMEYIVIYMYKTQLPEYKFLILMRTTFILMPALYGSPNTAILDWRTMGIRERERVILVVAVVVV